MNLRILCHLSLHTSVSLSRNILPFAGLTLTLNLDRTAKIACNQDGSFLRILQVSDLHFGAHNDKLKQNLLDRTRSTFKPDIIVATGDLVDRPTAKNLGEAFAFLQELSLLCNSSGLLEPTDPKLLVIPGNHDVNYLFGSAWQRRGEYDNHFGAIHSMHYYERQRLWIYGFDSARDRASGAIKGPTTGAIGKIRSEQITHFQHQYEDLQRKHGDAFDTAYKIIALHHHPLPVKESHKLQRWLLLDNAGTLLAVALRRKIDLILHGHEHEQARATFWSTFGGSSAAIHVISAGACLANVELNHVNVIVIDEDGSVVVEAYRAKKGTEAFEEQPELYSVRDTRRAHEKQLHDALKKSGFVFSEVTSTSILNEDGDCNHFVQCDDLQITEPVMAKATLNRIVLPATTGDIDHTFIRLKVRRGEELGDMRLTDLSSAGGKLHFGRSLIKDELISFEYNWWSLNAFAMDERQYGKKYKDSRNREMAFFNVLHPIKSLTITVKFPESFKRQTANIGKSLMIRVKTLAADGQSPQESAKALVQELRASHALKYIESLNVATLHVTHPVVGHAYAISWQVPPFAQAPSGVPERAGAQKIQTILREIEARQKQPTKAWRRSLRALLVTIAELFHAELMPDWNGSLELSLMVFKEATCKLEDVAGIQLEEGWTKVKLKEKDLSELDLHRYDVSVNYGAGVAGKVFKTNDNRLWIKIPPEQRSSPDYYIYLKGSPDHAVLLSMPLQNPLDTRYVYAVINCGSTSDECSLRSVGESERDKEKLGKLQKSLNQLCMEMLEAAVVEQKKGREEFGP